MGANTNVQDKANPIHLNKDVIFDLLDEVESEEALWDLMFQYFQGFGMSDMGYHHLYPLGSYDYDKKAFVCRGRNQDIVKNYTDETLEHAKSLIVKIRALAEPISFSEFRDAENLTSHHLKVMQDLYFNYTSHGFILPLHGALGRSGCFVLGFEGPSREYSKNDIRCLHWVGLAAHRTYCRLTELTGRRVKGLSKREREVLSWVARGKSNSVIADIIGISPHTVNGDGTFSAP